MGPEEIFLALLTPAGMADPYPLYAALHEHGEVIATGQALVLVSGYEAANAVLRDAGYRMDDADYFDHAFPDWWEHPAWSTDGLLNLNGADHARVRTLMARQFTHRRVQALEPTIATLTDALLDAGPDLPRLRETAGDARLKPEPFRRCRSGQAARVASPVKADQSAA